MKFLTIFFILISLNAYTLNITTHTKNSKGEVIISIYNKNGTIPDKNLNKYYKQKTVKIINNTVKVSFELKKGIYAVNVIHDENNNHKIDMGFLLPKEGIGFSNFKSISPFHKPNFKKASFKLDSNKSLNIKMIYF